MSLSNYQGTPMTVRYAHKRTYDPTTLSQAEINLLRKKYKNNPEKLKEINNMASAEEKESRKEKIDNKKKMKEDCQKINQRHSPEWHSVQDRSNEIALQCLGKFKKED